MMLTFKEIGISAPDLNGMSAVLARAIVINKACDYIMQHHFQHLPEHEAIPSPRTALVDFVHHAVSIDTATIPTH